MKLLIGIIVLLVSVITFVSGSVCVWTFEIDTDIYKGINVTATHIFLNCLIFLMSMAVGSIGYELIGDWRDERECDEEEDSQV